jgi:predicted ATPase/DNA-binding CsgD family transcriptional regulator/transcriptional regulator with XRE-family HTH domain
MTTEPPETFGDLLRHARRNAGLTQETLAERAGVSTRSISSLERGINRSPRLDTFDLLAKALDLSPADRRQWEQSRIRLSSRLEQKSHRASPDDQHSRHHVSMTMTTFVGRQREIGEIVELLREPGCRLVTLTGTGGVGKTRLALMVAHEAGDAYIDGIWFVNLAPLNEPVLVLPTIARTLNIIVPANQSPVAAVTEALRDKRVLILLDNVEHVVQAAVEIAMLVQECSALTILATSRTPLRLQAEQEYPVSPLEVPGPDHVAMLENLKQNESVSLFIERARAARPDFHLVESNAQAVAGICQRLDGIPLAIELAAARIRQLSPLSMFDRLDDQLSLLTGGARDLPVRQQTLRGTVAWSYDLLTPEEQHLFRQLSVFRGGWTLDAAEAFVDGGDVLDGLARLIDHSLVRVRDQPDGSTRFGMLETIREFGLEQLETWDEAIEARQRHARYFLELAVEVGPKLVQAEQVHWLALLESEHDNLRSALNWATEDDLNLALRAAKGLYNFWLLHGHLAEARRWLERALSIKRPTLKDVRAEAQVVAASLASWQGDYDRADVLLSDALAAFESVGDQHGIADTLRAQARMEMAAGNYLRADQLGRESAAIFRRLGDVNGLMRAFSNMGWNTIGLRELERGRALLAEALELAQEQNNPASVCNYLTGLAFIDLDLGDIEPARQQFVQTLELSRSVGDLRFVALSLEGLGRVAHHQGMHEHACLLLAAANALRAKIGTPVVEDFLRPQLESSLADICTRLSADRYDALWREGSRISLDETIELALGTETEDLLNEPPSGPGGSLSPRECEVLRLITDGRTDREIAAELFISPHTARRHVSHILNKLGLDSRTAAAAYAFRSRFV